MNMLSLVLGVGFAAAIFLITYKRVEDLGKVSKASIKDAIRREERKGYDAPVGQWPPRKVADDFNS